MQYSCTNIIPHNGRIERAMELNKKLGLILISLRLLVPNLYFQSSNSPPECSPKKLYAQGVTHRGAKSQVNSKVSKGDQGLISIDGEDLVDIVPRSPM